MQVLNEEGLVYFPIPEDQLAFCAWRGSAVHYACLLDDEGDLDEATVEPAHRGYLEAWRKCKALLRPEFICAETQLYNSVFCYAGTIDRLVRLPGKRRPQLWDLKTGIPQKAARIQTAAYAHLTMPHASHGPYEYDRYAVRLTKEGDYAMQEHPLADLSKDFEMFRAALMLNAWKKENR